jgi:hypothetical protein
MPRREAGMFIYSVGCKHLCTRFEGVIAPLQTLARYALSLADEIETTFLNDLFE